ncbi:MAG: PSD1 and planctomycete cytochrome C domain-containing protein [Planctomycetota bacterium]
MLNRCSLAFSLLCLCPVALAETPLRFNRDVRSILTDKCLACHGPDGETVEGGLRLDQRENAIESAIVPGDPDASELVRRILSTDESEVMPPPETNKPLSAQERDVLRRWIAEGAEYEPHWAYTPMRRARQPSPTLSKTIDSLLGEQIKQQGLSPVPRADRVTLIRRLSFDLTGMPPTPDQVDQFLADKGKDAYASLVDRLLDSPRYGERMATYWLDLVRYADTVGYHGDQNVSQSPYRDYVIRSFNLNLPYDQFIREQLAGDLLPDATLQQQVASGYNRLNQTTEEGGSQAKEYLAIYFADRVRNVSQVFMGATVGCAQCHDHKYDPYTARDFYSLGAFFADLDERGVYGARSRPPVIRVPSDELQKKLAAMDVELETLDKKRAALRTELLKQQDTWETDAITRLDEKVEVETAWVDDAILVDGKKNGEWRYVGGDKAPVHSAKKSREQQADGLVQHFFDGAEKTFIVADESKFYAWVHLDPDNPPKAVMLQLNDGNWEHRKVWGSDDITFGRRDESHAGYQRAGELPPSGEWFRLEVDASQVGLKTGAKVVGMAFTQFGGKVHWDAAGALSISGIPDNVAQSLRTAKDQRTEEQRSAISEQYLTEAESMIAINRDIEATKTARQVAFESAPQTVVAKAVKPRTIRILPRGNWLDDSGEIVTPAIPAFLGKLDTGDRQPTRLDLANWLCQEDNPLTARTMVNRLWSLLFGRGICSSVDDFGGQGTYPSDPELLDELALEFIRAGWDIKHIVRSIVMSETYQRSSTPNQALTEGDPYNDWFARQGRFCVEAESVRDAALLISGLLVDELGGPSVRPYQPAGYYAQLNFPRRKYQADQGDSQYRRGLYTHWQRTFLHPMLKAFDAPSREECTAARARSNTPLQALALLNDPTFVEAARVFAARILREGGDDVDARVDWAYRTAVSRSPEDRIAQELVAVFRSHHTHYQSNPDAARELTSAGFAPVAKDLDPVELAAWTGVARVILNLHETITRY